MQRNMPNLCITPVVISYVWQIETPSSQYPVHPKEFLEKQLSNELEKIMESKNIFVAPSSDSAKVTILNDDNEEKYTSQVISPIISEGDPIGAVMFLSMDPKSKMGDVETKLAQSAATFLGKHMEQ